MKKIEVHDDLKMQEHNLLVTVDKFFLLELDKKILTKGAWATVIFKFQSWDNGKNAYTPVKYTIRRYQKRNGVYQAKSKFNISSNDQAQKIIGALTEWLSEEDSNSD